MLRSIPLPMSRARIAEAREAATESNWFAGCPEERCRAAGRCCGAVRRLEPDGPRCYPTCMRLAMAACLDTEFTADDRAALEDMLECDPHYDPDWSEETADDEAPESSAMLTVSLMLTLSTPNPSAPAASGPDRPGLSP